MVRRRLIYGHLLLLAAGLLLGWLYDQAATGLLVAALLALGWQLRQLLRFEAALRSHHFGRLKYGDNIWSQMYSRFAFQRGRAKQFRSSYRKLAKEVRKSANAMPDGGIILDEGFAILLCNKAAQRLAGFRRKEDRGQRVDNILRDPAFGEYLKSDDFSAGVEIRSPVREDGWLHCRIVPYGASQKLLLIQDITERRRLSTMRREFVANASHELRSPLTVLSGYLDSLAEDESLPSDWQKPVEQMQSQTSRMNKIVSELLELSRLEGAGSAPIDEVVDICGLLAAAKKSVNNGTGVAEIVIDCKSRTPLCGSSAEIESIIVNLMTNAIRHTPADGRITMSWSVGESGGVLVVDDTGIGIEPEYIPRLTERFFRIDAGRSREEGGVGLGLAIVKHILERHDGKLIIDSTPGKGSRFSCQFPLSRMATDAPVPIAGNH